MADDRNPGFQPAGMQGFGPMGMNPQFMMMQQQPNPMMQQNNPMLQQQMMMQRQMFQQRMQMYPGQANQGAYNMTPQQMALMQQQSFAGPRGAPPPYNQQMAKEFHHKQRFGSHQAKTVQDQQKFLEQQIKARKFQEQQKKLKEFSTLGARKMDADSLIQSIVGKPDPSKSKSAAANVNAKAVPPGGQGLGEMDDSFGDFMQGPSAVAVDPSNPPLVQAGQSATTANGPTANPSQDGTTMATAGQVTSGSNNFPGETVEEKREKNDLKAPPKAKTFSKPTVKEIQPVKKRTVMYQQSQKSRTWNSDTPQLTELFTLQDGQRYHPPVPPSDQMETVPAVTVDSEEPAEEVQAALEAQQASHRGQPPAAPAPIVLPKWCTGEAPVPELYNQVLEACIREEKINTEVLYPILIQSGLPRETLGHIWAISNRATPGQLIKEELWMVLALIAIAQHNVAFNNVDILARCPVPPIPYLGQPQQQKVAPAAAGPTEHAHGVSEVPPGSAAYAGPPPDGSTLQAPPALQPVGPTTGGVGITPVVSNEDDDFADFQEAPCPPAAVFGGAAMPTPPAQTSMGWEASFETESEPVQAPPTDLIGEEDKYSYLRVVAEKEESGKDSSTVKPIGPVLTTDTANEEFADFTSFQNEPAQPCADTSFAEQNGTPRFADFGKAEETTARIDGDFAEFKSAEEFTDFQQVNAGQSQEKNENMQKIAALKALVMDQSLFNQKLPKPGDPAVESQEGDLKESGDDWADFQTSDVQDSQTSSDTDKYGAFKDSEQNSSQNVFSSAENLSGGDTWAAFQTSDQGSTFNTIDWTQMDSTNKMSTKQTIDTASLNADKKPKRTINYFGRNLDVGGVSAGTGMSPLDFQPPDLDDIKDEEDEDDFDKFGTFQSGGSGNNRGPHTEISSISLHGIDEDFGSFNSHTRNTTNNTLQVNKGATKETADSQSTASFEFTGWKNSGTSPREDSQSISSLDLGAVKPQKNSKDGSPSGIDSQSVSSLEFGGFESGHKSGSPQDQRSVASLELKENAGDASSQGSQQDSQPTTDDGFGEFRSAGSEHTGSALQSPVDNCEYIQRPRAASELLTIGDMPSIGDRYSNLIQQPQDSDRHIYDWQRCLEKACELVQQANNTFNAISSSTICNEVICSLQGSEYLSGIVEIYRVVCRITQAMKAVSISNPHLEEVLKNTDLAWTNLTAFIATSPIMPEQGSLDFGKGVLRAEDDNAQHKACGICLLNVDARSKAFLREQDCHKLTYGGRQYHATCANFWVNCVDSTLPALKIPELL